MNRQVSAGREFPVPVYPVKFKIESERYRFQSETAKQVLNQTAILYAMLSDMPYYLYWFHKTKKTGGMDLDIESNDGMKDFLVEYETEKAMSYPDKTYFIAGSHRFISSDPDQPNLKGNPGG